MQQDDKDKPILETETYKLIRQSDFYILVHKTSKRTERVTIDVALCMMELNDEINELYTK